MNGKLPCFLHRDLIVLSTVIIIIIIIIIIIMFIKILDWQFTIRKNEIEKLKFTIDGKYMGYM